MLEKLCPSSNNGTPKMALRSGSGYGSGSSRSRQSASPHYPPPELKLFRACEACAKAKTKCDDVTDKGCSRCRARRLGCSLMEALGVSRDHRDHRDRETDRPRLGENGHANGSGSGSGYPEDPPGTMQELVTVPVPVPVSNSIRAGSSGPPSSSWTYDAQAAERQQRLILAMEERIRYLEERVMANEAGMHSLVPGAASATSLSVASQGVVQVLDPASLVANHSSAISQFTTGSAPPHPTPDAVSAENFYQIRKRRLDPNIYRKCIQKGTSAIEFDERIDSALGEEDYPNVVKRGIVTSQQVDMAFHMFKHIFSELIPLAPFMDVSTPTPAHPFLVVAVLAHVQDVLPEKCNFEGIIDDSILHCMASGASYEAMLALFILSMAPLVKGNLDHIPVTAFRLISLAHSMGQDLELDRRAEMALRGVKYATREQLERAMTWVAVRNHYWLWRTLMTRIGKVPHDICDLLPADLPPRYAPTAAAIQLQCEMLEIVSPITEWLGQAELDAPSRWVDLEGLNNEWFKLAEKVNQARNGPWAEKAPAVYQFDLEALLYTLSVRVSILLVNPYLVLSPDVLAHAQTTAYIFNKDTCAAIIKAFLALRKTHPHIADSRRVVTISTAALSTARRMVHIMKYSNPLAAKLMDMSVLEQAEDVVRKMPNLAGELVRVSWDQLEDGFPSVPDKQPSEQPPAIDLVSLGLEGFDWLLQPMF